MGRTVDSSLLECTAARQHGNPASSLDTNVRCTFHTNHDTRTGQRDPAARQRDSDVSVQRSIGVGYSPMSIEGVVPVLCVREPACVGTRSSGYCPEPQAGLESGSYCDIVRTGVYGCKAYNATAVAYPALPACNGAYGDTPVSVVGAGTFCAPQPVCSGGIAGKCPTQQDGLYHDSVCAIIETGVYGCVLPVV